MDKLTGFYGFLYSIPTWEIFAGLSFICIGSLMEIRDVFEKMAYNNSRASRLGDFILIIGLSIGIESFKYMAHIPGWVIYGFFSWPSVIFTTITSGIVYHIFILALDESGKRQSLADTYHNVIIVPLLIFSSLSITPFIWFYGSCSSLEKIVSGCCFMAYPIIMYFDYKQGRLKNNTYQIEKGIPRFYGKLGYRISVFPLVQGAPKKY